MRRILFALLFCLTLVAGPALFGQQSQAEPPVKAKVSGKVMGRNGMPVRKAEVKLVPWFGQGGPGGQSATADTEGSFEFKDIEPGWYRLSASKSGFLQQEYGSRAAGQPGVPLVLAKGQEMKAVSFTLAPASSISGRVLDEDEEPLDRCMVMVLRQTFLNGKAQWLPRGGGMGNSKGEFNVGDLPAGKYLVVANPFGQQLQVVPKVDGEEKMYIQMYHPGVTDALAATPIEVGLGTELTGIDIRMKKQRVYRVSGSIPQGSGTLYAVALPSSDGPTLTFMPRSQVPTQGEKFEFSLPLEPGNYRVLAVIGTIFGDMYGPADVTVSNQNVDGVILNKLQTATLVGKVSVEGSGVKPSNLQIFLRPKRPHALNQGTTANVSEDGTFKVEKLFPDRYTLGVNIKTPAGYLKRFKVGDEEPTDRVIDLSRGTAAPVEMVVSEKAATLNGHVEYGQGKPLARATAVLFPADSRLREFDWFWRSASTGGDGNFTMTHLAPGKYKLLVWEEVEPNSWQDPAVLAKVESQAVEVEIAEGDSKTVPVKPMLSTRITDDQRDDERRRTEEAMKSQSAAAAK